MIVAASDSTILSFPYLVAIIVVVLVIVIAISGRLVDREFDRHMEELDAQLHQRTKANQHEDSKD